MRVDTLAVILDAKSRGDVAAARTHAPPAGWRAQHPSASCHQRARVHLCSIRVFPSLSPLRRRAMLSHVDEFTQF